jgi:ribosomal-protein-alanine N-acetyltransferase
MELLPIKEKLEENARFESDPLCREGLYMSLDFFKRVGYTIPWIGYFAQKDGVLVGAAAFKGAPQNATVEIAYGTFEPYRKSGIATEICRLLVELSLKTDPSVKITARTLPENNYSTRVLEKNGFQNSGIVNDPEDGDVWEWVYCITSKG